MEPRYRKHVHAQEMFEKIERYLAGISSQAEFCQQEGLAYWTFRYWLKQYRLRDALSRHSATPSETEKPLADFIPLRITPVEPPAPSPSCMIEFPSGVVVRFNGSVEPSVLAQLIHTQQAEP